MRRLWLSIVALLLATPVAAADCPPAHDDPGVFDPGLSASAFPASIDGLHAFALQNGIRSLSELLAFLPDDMRRNYALMEHSGTGNAASVDFPRLVAFTADAGFAIAVNTHPANGAWEQADLVQLGSDGRWHFAALRFDAGGPVLSRDERQCRACHAATPNVPPESDAPLVPRWGGYPVWPGAFGDDGARQKAGLTAAQADVLNGWLAFGAPERLDALVLKPVVHYAGLPFLLPEKPGTSGLNHLNADLGPRHGLGVQRRFRRDPDYARHRYAYLALHCVSHPSWRGGLFAEVERSAAELGVPPTWQGFWQAFGIPHPDYEADLGALPGTTPVSWSDGFDGVRSYADVLVLKELAEQDWIVDLALRSVPDAPSLYSNGCFANKREAVDWLALYNFSERSLHQAIRAERKEGMRAWRGVLYESRQTLCPVFLHRLTHPEDPECGLLGIEALPLLLAGLWRRVRAGARASHR